jgi:F-type H+-transporting ATPase subunit epsilon
MGSKFKKKVCMFKLNFATPERAVVTNQEMEEVTVPAFAGELNILPGHSPLMTTLDAGILSYKLKDGKTYRAAISWGYCQISADGVNVLAENAAYANEVDVNTLKQHLKDNESKILNETLSDVDWKKANHEIARLRAELDLLSGSK